jgi:hypothetical protein
MHDKEEQGGGIELFGCTKCEMQPEFPEISYPVVC